MHSTFFQMNQPVACGVAGGPNPRYGHGRAPYVRSPTQSVRMAPSMTRSLTESCTFSRSVQLSTLGDDRVSGDDNWGKMWV